MTVFSSVLRRDMRYAARRGGEILSAVFFFAVVTALFPFAMEGRAENLRLMAGGIVWISALLSALLALESFYHRDHDDGTFDLLLLSGAQMEHVIAAKILAHWLSVGLPLVCVSALACVMFAVPVGVLPAVLASLLLGTIYLSLLGGLGAVLTLGSKRPALLLAVLILPLFVPLLILGVSGFSAALADLPVRPYLLLQLALVVLALPSVPLAAGGFLRMSLKS